MDTNQRMFSSPKDGKEPFQTPTNLNHKISALIYPNLNENHIGKQDSTLQPKSSISFSQCGLSLIALGQKFMLF